MNRIDVVELMQELFPEYKTYNVGQNYVRADIPYFVVRAGTQLRELSGSRLGAYQIIDIMIYVPNTSIVMLDNLVEEVYNRIKNHESYCKYIEFTGTVSQDYHDYDIEMYTRYITIQIPREW